MFTDQSLKVREAISWVIRKICEVHAEVLVSSPQLTQHFITVIQSSLQDKPSVSIQSCTAIEKLAESLQPVAEGQTENALTPYFMPLANALIVNSERTDFEGTSHNLLLGSYAALIALSQYCCTGSLQAVH